MFKNIFANISAHGGPFFKPIFALKPWDGDGRFEYNKRYKGSYKKVKYSQSRSNIIKQNQVESNQARQNQIESNGFRKSLCK